MNVLACPVCKHEIPRFGESSGFEVTCQNCQSTVSCILFSSFSQTIPQGVKGKPVTEAKEASCYNHSGRQASSGCEACGRLVCPVCDVKVGGRSYCPTCLTSVALQETMPVLVPQRLCYEKAAWCFGLLSFYPFFGPFIFAPAVLIMAFLTSSEPGSLLGGKRGWMYASVFMSMLSIVFLVGIVAMLILIITQAIALKHHQ